MYLDQEEFYAAINERYPHIVTKYESLRYRIAQDPKNFDPLYIRCYWCQGKGHIATNCDFFEDIRGNMKRDQQDPAKIGEVNH